MSESPHVVKIERILHPTDFSPSSAYALAFAVSFAREFAAKLYILHVIEDVAQALYFDMLQAPPLTEAHARSNSRAQPGCSAGSR